MRGTAYNFGTMVRQPAFRQIIATDWALASLCITSFIVAGMEDILFSSLLFWASLIISVCLIYRVFYLRSMKFIIMDEQIVYEHGVFHKTRDFLELYRVVDFKEESSFIQQIFSLKTVVIYSGDRSTPRLDMLGLDKSDNIIPIIRERVSANRKRNSIYEITNR